MKKGKKSAYARAGVNIDEKMRALSAAKRMIHRTATKGVIADIGPFGGMFASPGDDNVLVASADGVGTKLKVAVMAGRHDTVGQDIVNHCVNDILVQGARPLFFMDYFGTARFDARIFRCVMAGLCRACRQNGCALLGGETAEMPGLYPEGEYDLVGTIVGTVDRKEIVTGEHIKPGDMVIGLRSSGLHTNGYSLARKAIFEKAGLKIGDTFPGASRTVGDVLLEVHRSYLKPIGLVRKKVEMSGMAHITGGGFPDNIRRVLPRGTEAVLDCRSWRVPALFEFIRKAGGVALEEMYRVFNMGIGFVLMVREGDTDETMSVLKAAGEFPAVIGYVRGGKRGVVLTGISPQ